ncbi:MAG: BON domain-containing protein [Candidatus Paracaedimonas acanthamoebae]|uniref:BON domain-containing protein n=1 Tax=Candidatus Paracaedimonas acanthamoebae TaxID=244581 RepID=A0A8J7TV29_9PROT|nr:BON domain-containing protein [Candidatus Paracaedimonas acanthamoebae]
MKTMLVSASTLMGLFMLSGCAPVAFMGGATSVTTSASEERGVKGVFSDAKIKAHLQSKWMDKRPELVMATNVVVRQGRVLITGELETTEQQIDAVRYAWQVPGVKEVVDETTVGKTSSFQQYARDTWISTQLKTKILKDDDIRSLNYNLHTENGTVYLMGIAQNQQELDKVTNYARHIGGVRKVTSYVTIKSQTSGEIQEKTPHSQGQVTLEDFPSVEASGESLTPQTLDEPNTGSSFQ